MAGGQNAGLSRPKLGDDDPLAFLRYEAQQLGETQHIFHVL